MTLTHSENKYGSRASLAPSAADGDFNNSRRPSKMSQTLENVAQYQFNDDLLRRLVPVEVYMAFKDANSGYGRPLTQEDKDTIAEAMGTWAIDMGAAQYAHVFYPMRAAGVGVLGGSEGLKHDAFVELDFKSKDHSVKPLRMGKFTGDQLFKGETDGSSFPNGGLRCTHEAGAWTSWDRTSPPFVVEDTLMIPCCLISQEGKALDEKTPLLRSNDAVNKQALRILRLLGYGECKQVITNVGPEQEFFVIDRDMYVKRPDLMACGRTVLGKCPPKGQEESLNYFSQIQPRIKQFFVKFHETCWKLGLSNAVMHNEVAPAQCEVSHIFTLTNVASDWNILHMSIMNQIALEHGLIVLLHEKPFQGINGNGKHNNWGLFTDRNDVLFTPGKTPKEEERFMMFTSCLVHAVSKHGDVLRAGVASAGNDHRLGAQEAPPAIISMYVGQAMEEHIDKIIAGGPLAGYKSETKVIVPGCSQISNIDGRAEDRNRTSPLPFCGNRFEFRAVGSGQNISWPLTCINTIMAASMCELADKVEGGQDMRSAVADMFKDGRRVLFQGDNYSAEWHAEAALRKLPNLKDTPSATKALVSEKNIKLFEDMKVYDRSELESRQNNMFDAYAQIVSIEARVMVQMMDTAVIPAMAQDLKTYETPLTKHFIGEREVVYKRAFEATKKLKEILFHASKYEDGCDLAFYYSEKVLPAMAEVREAHDEAETLIATSLYPFPGYQVLLFDHHSGMTARA